MDRETDWQKAQMGIEARRADARGQASVVLPLLWLEASTQDIAESLPELEKVRQQQLDWGANERYFRELETAFSPVPQLLVQGGELCHAVADETISQTMGSMVGAIDENLTYFSLTGSRLKRDAARFGAPGPAAVYMEYGCSDVEHWGSADLFEDFAALRERLRQAHSHGHDEVEVPVEVVTETLQDVEEFMMPYLGKLDHIEEDVYQLMEGIYLYEGVYEDRIEWLREVSDKLRAQDVEVFSDLDHQQLTEWLTAVDALQTASEMRGAEPEPVNS